MNERKEILFLLLLLLLTQIQLIIREVIHAFLKIVIRFLHLLDLRSSILGLSFLGQIRVHGPNKPIWFS